MVLAPTPGIETRVGKRGGPPGAVVGGSWARQRFSISRPRGRSTHHLCGCTGEVAGAAGGMAGAFEVDAEVGGVVDEVLAVAAAAPALPGGAVGGGEPIEEGPLGGEALGARGGAAAARCPNGQ